MAAQRLQIGLLQCGHINERLAEVDGDYPQLFDRLLSPHGVEVTTYDVTLGQLPDDPSERDGWLISGSAASVYDDRPWIAPTEAFVRRLVADRSPTVGVCFGHQLAAQALGGEVRKADVGWGVGVRRYELVDEGPAWHEGAGDGDEIGILAMHQDQVVRLPEGAQRWLTADYCPEAGFTIGDHLLTIQPHPEFTTTLTAGLLATRRERVGDEVVDAALASLDDRIDAAAVASWMTAFLRRGPDAPRAS
ncbi:MAG: hypothetical protein KDA97_02650 [Acidimicrobiales bacterium]|nr:hypothetical protein [Acidimicrobiales bacterium]